METPSPVPNDSGAELAADDDIEIVKVNQGETFFLSPIESVAESLKWSKVELAL